MRTSKREPLIVVLLLMVAIAIGMYLLPVESHVIDFLQWLSQMEFWGSVILTVAFVLASIVFFPESILTLAAGALFGLVGGTIVASVGSTLAALITFLLGRTLARDWVSEQLADHPHFSTIEKALDEQGFKIVLLTRLILFFPFSFLNYAYGVTQVSTRDYLLASFLGTLVPTLLYVYVGTTMKTLADLYQGRSAVSGVETIVMVIGLLITLIAMVFIVRTARRALAEATERA